jgi:hypothetical protein
MLYSSFFNGWKRGFQIPLPKNIENLAYYSNLTFEKLSEVTHNYTNFGLKTKFNKKTIEFSLQNKSTHVIEKSYPNFWLRGNWV